MRAGNTALHTGLAVGLAAGLLSAGAPAADKDKKDRPPPKPVVIHVGDSFVGSGFAKALKPRFEAVGAKYISQSVTSAYTTTLPRQVKLDSMMTVHKPVLAIVTIGANEMAMPIPEQHAHAVRNISKLLSATTCVWALPPRWNDKETGFRDVMKREAAPCKIHDPEEIAARIERGPDKIHPTPKGGAMWAEHFWASLTEGKTQGELPWEPAKPAQKP
jgi:lysophospholipase L1-like esterase